MSPQALYKKYLTMPLPQRNNGRVEYGPLHPSRLVQTGLAIAAPHPTRHFTEAEFVCQCFNDPEFPDLVEQYGLENTTPPDEPATKA